MTEQEIRDFADDVTEYDIRDGKPFHEDIDRVMESWLVGLTADAQASISEHDRNRLWELFRWVATSSARIILKAFIDESLAPMVGAKSDGVPTEENASVASVGSAPAGDDVGARPAGAAVSRRTA